MLLREGRNESIQGEHLEVTRTTAGGFTPKILDNYTYPFERTYTGHEVLVLTRKLAF